ncbi:MAG: hypothetical protein ACRENW_07955, partial [Thermodesulfobacteriota bacterium]
VIGRPSVSLGVMEADSLGFIAYPAPAGERIMISLAKESPPYNPSDKPQPPSEQPGGSPPPQDETEGKK